MHAHRRTSRSFRRLALAFTAAAAIASAPAVAAGYNDADYRSIAAKAKQLDGPPVEISSNYWLAWTGAWDTVIMKEARLWEKWLPKGSKVNWKRNLQGPPVITDLIANKQQIGYIGDNPSIVATTKRALAPINIVAVNEISNGRMCGMLLVRSDAPKFGGYKEAIKWLDGKVVGVPKGSCADRLGQYMLKKEGIKVTWQQMQAEVIVTSLQAKKIDAAALYEPHLSKAVFDGHARYAVSPAAYGENDANTVVMRKDFIEKNRDVAIAWLKANIEALYFLRDHPIETINYVKKELPEYTKENLWYAIYGRPPAETGADDIALKGVMTFTPEVRELLKRGYAFLREIQVVHEPDLHPEALQNDLVVQAFKELGLDPSKGLFEIKAGTKNPFKGDELIK
ncbi:MAG: ABC transporter substrate-binding protein [Pseudomonadota bacterium]